MPDTTHALVESIASALGDDATPERVEQIARGVLMNAQPSGQSGQGEVSPELGPSRPAPGATRFLVTAYGVDSPGVLSTITAELADAGANILDVSQKVLQGYFTVILLADLPGQDLSTLQGRLLAKGEQLGVRVLVQHEDLFQAMHRP